MSRSILSVILFLSAGLAFGQQDAPNANDQQAPSPQAPILIDYAQLSSLLDEKLSPLVKRLESVEQAQAKDRQVNLKLCDDGFVSRKSTPPCNDTTTPKNGDAAQNAGQVPKTCNLPECSEAYIPSKRLSTTWITAYKKVTITKQVPYVEVVNEWDQHACCYKSVSVTKSKLEEREIVVPYKKEVIVEEVGMEKIKVCLAD